MKFIKKYGLYVLMGLMIGLPASAVIQTSGVQYFAGLGLTRLWVSSTAPTISSGFGTSAVVVTNNGTGAFEVNIGTGGTATSGVIGLPTASTDWVCTANDITTTSSAVFMTKQIASTTSTVTIGNYNTSGALAAWIASDVIHLTCLAY